MYSFTPANRHGSTMDRTLPAQYQPATFIAPDENYKMGLGVYHIILELTQEPLHRLVTNHVTSQHCWWTVQTTHFPDRTTSLLNLTPTIDLRESPMRDYVNTSIPQSEIPPISTSETSMGFFKLVNNTKEYRSTESILKIYHYPYRLYMPHESSAFRG